MHPRGNCHATRLRSSDVDRSIPASRVSEWDQRLHPNHGVSATRECARILDSISRLSLELVDLVESAFRGQPARRRAAWFGRRCAAARLRFLSGSASARLHLADQTAIGDERQWKTREIDIGPRWPAGLLAATGMLAESFDSCPPFRPSAAEDAASSAGDGRAPDARATWNRSRHGPKRPVREHPGWFARIRTVRRAHRSLGGDTPSRLARRSQLVVSDAAAGAPVPLRPRQPARVVRAGSLDHSPPQGRGVPF